MQNCVSASTANSLISTSLNWY